MKIALIGNPNAGKTSLFNNLTGLNQKVGNFPGVTVERKSGKCKLPTGMIAEVVDLPGTYSINPKSLDEHVVFDSLIGFNKEEEFDLIVVIVDETNLKRNLLLFTQIKDLGIPVILALNMVELAQKTGVKVDREKLEQNLHLPVVEINARTGLGVEELKRRFSEHKGMMFESVFKVESFAPDVIHEVKKALGLDNNYKAFQVAVHFQDIAFLSDKEKRRVAEIRQKHQFNEVDIQTQETIQRYHYIDKILDNAISGETVSVEKRTNKIDKILTHNIWGYVIFVSMLFIIFQSVFTWAIYPMEWIDSGFAQLSEWTEATMAPGLFSDLLANGIIPGIAGVMIFIPQIAILMGLIAILEETGYMARVMYLMDRLMRRFGMSGRSVVPLVSAVACAVPAIMAARPISGWKNRIITIMVTPLMSCSARLPVYVVLIALVVPSERVLGVLNLQGLALFGMYVFGFVMTVLSAVVFRLLVKARGNNYFVLELPAYRRPRWKNVTRDIWQKLKEFIWEAGKIIVTISIILWALASFGPGNQREEARQKVLTAHQITDESQIDDAIQNEIDAKQLEVSFAGHFGKFIEPVIEPLGYDWKIGIAIISSFAAREIFVGTMGTLYSIGGDADEAGLINKMRSEINPKTGRAFFTVPVAFSLLVFYALAMQCMSTLAIVYRETKSIKWPLIQFGYMTGLAYFFSWLTFNILS